MLLETMLGSVLTAWSGFLGQAGRLAWVSLTLVVNVQQHSVKEFLNEKISAGVITRRVG